MPGRFFLGDMVGGRIRFKALPVLPGGYCSAARFGQGEIVCTIRPDMVVSSNGTAVHPYGYWGAITQMNDYLGYIDEMGTNQSLINMGPITSISLTSDGLQLRAGGISTYLDARYHEDSTVPLSSLISGQRVSLNETIFNPSATTFPTWLNRTMTNLEARQTYLVADDLKVPIGWTSTGTQGTDDPTPPSASLQLPFAGSDFRTFYGRLNEISDAFGATWAVRPAITGQVFTTVSSINWANAETVEWDVYAQNIYFSNQPETLSVFWSPEANVGITNLSFTQTNANYYTMLHGTKPSTGTNIRYWGLSGYDPEGAVPALLGSGAEKGVVVEKRWDGQGEEPNMTSGVDEGFKFVGGKRAWKFDLAINGNVRPGWDLPGKLIHLNLTDHPALRNPFVETTEVAVRIGTITVTDGSKWFTVEGVEE